MKSDYQDANRIPVNGNAVFLCEKCGNADINGVRREMLESVDGSVGYVDLCSECHPRR